MKTTRQKTLVNVKGKSCFSTLEYKRNPIVSDSDSGSKNKVTPLSLALEDENNASENLVMCKW